MVEYTIDDIRGPTVAREMAQLKEFVLAKFNGAIADAEAAAAQAATDAANAVLSSIDSRVGALEGDMTTAQGDIVANANAILALDGSVVKLAGAQTIPGAKTFSVSPTVPAPTNATDAANKKYVDDYHDATKLNINDINSYAVGLTGNQSPILGIKEFENIVNVNSLSNRINQFYGYGADSSESWWKVYTKVNSSWNKASFICIFDDNDHTFTILYVGGFGTSTQSIFAYKLLGSFPVDRIRVAAKSGNADIFVQANSATNRVHTWVMYDIQGSTVPHPTAPPITAITPTVSIEPVVGDTYDYVKTPTVIQ